MRHSTRAQSAISGIHRVGNTRPSELSPVRPSSTVRIPGGIAPTQSRGMWFLVLPRGIRSAQRAAFKPTRARIEFLFRGISTSDGVRTRG